MRSDDKLNGIALRDASSYEHKRMMTYIGIAAFVAMSSMVLIALAV